MRKLIGKKIDALLSIVIIAILLPLFITTICQRMQLEEIIYGELQVTESGQNKNLGQGEIGTSAVETGAGQAESKADEAEDKTRQIETDSAQIEEQVLAIVANEIGMDAPKQAILAQCVIARTNLYDAKLRGIAEPQQMNVEEMRKLWGEDFEKVHSQLEEYVAQTKEQVLSWKGSCIYAAYHAISAGETRDMTELYEDAKMPYLIAQSCNADVTAEGYLSVSYEETESFLQKCAEGFPENPPQSIADIVVNQRDEAGYVMEVSVGGKTYTGEEFRSRLGLNSACFTVTELDGKARIVTKGLGHGVGLSQYTAESMASEGKNYEEILEYFYPGTKLVNVSEIK